MQPNEYPDSAGCGILQRERDVVKEEELAALEELSSAMKSGGALRLQRALAQAEEAHVEQHPGGAEMLQLAQQSTSIQKLDEETRGHRAQETKHCAAKGCSGIGQCGSSGGGHRRT